MGASTEVPLSERVATWTDMLPRLLAHLNIPRVSLVAHSVGIIYLLNIWSKCREYINPVIFVIGIIADAPSTTNNIYENRIYCSILFI